MFIVALTGGIGSGKSEAANKFAELGVPITDLDAIAHQLTAANMPIIAVIKAAFGNEYITTDNALNRAAMRRLVFNDAAARAQLNAILHPAIFDAAMKQLQLNNHINTQANRQNNQQAIYQILAVPLLFESARYLPHIHRILVIDCIETTQIKRVQQRSQLSVADIKKIINAQTPRLQLLAMADDVIENNENVEKLREKIVKIHEKYLNTCIVSKTI